MPSPSNRLCTRIGVVSLEEHSRQTTHFLLLLSKHLKILVYDGHRQQYTGPRTNST